MTTPTLPRDKQTLIGLLKTAFRNRDETNLEEIVQELGPHIDSLSYKIQPHGRDGDNVTISLMYKDGTPKNNPGGNPPRMIQSQWPIQNQWPVDAGCRIARSLGIPYEETAETVEKCLKRLDAYAKFDRMASIVTFLTKAAGFGLILMPPTCRPVKTYRLNRVNAPLVEAWQSAAERHAQKHSSRFKFIRSA